MEKSKSFPGYVCSNTGEFGDQENSQNSYNFNGPRTKDDAQLKRKKRVATYNMFTTEGKIKSTVRDSFKWIKTKLSDIML
ncbi:hypothetical protein Leryth_019597 [Lithospermum erythrorhizon]|nr:hypothetical protein Leryth_019597 [Lithospermum erythrorhizon]